MQLEQNESLESSTSEQDVENQAQGQDSAQSSGAQGDEEGLLSVVRDAVEKTAQDEDGSKEVSPTRDEGNVEDRDDGQDSSEDADKQHADDFSDTPFHKHPRFKQLIRERNEFRSRATQYDQITDFMEKNQLTAEEVAQGFQMMAMMKMGDPSQAYEALKKVTDSMALAAGHKLPDHLAQKVEQGYIDQETAQDLWREQFKAQRQAAITATENQRFRQQEQRSVHNTIAEAVTAWEESVRESDPDYDLKADLIDDRVRALVAEKGKPRNTDEALAYAQDAYKTVSDRLKSVRGVKPPMRTAVGGKVSGTPLPEPKSLLDVIQNTLSQRA